MPDPKGGIRGVIPEKQKYGWLKKSWKPFFLQGSISSLTKSEGMEEQIQWIQVY